ncbi:ras-like protein [Anaeramoeba ignava]|uniref:small monomeric GTPase n=1 Tax=Anaeramoeba ignava TaxID=1746090 RepID=A0A9Q0LLT8_ANAIG|nr:ras-like protein [Anaeramoeba ignava]
MTTLRIVVVGSGGVGKSALTLQFVHSKFIEVYEPTIEDSYRKQVSIDNKDHVLEILDTAGQEEYSIIRDSHLRSGDGFLLVFAVDKSQTLEQIPKLKSQIARAKEFSNIPMLIVGNKIDLVKDRKVKKSTAKQLADSLDIPYLETSAKTKINVDEAFLQISRLILKFSDQNPSLSNLHKRKKKRACLLL